MKVIDYFIKSMKAEMYMDRRWLTRCVSIPMEVDEYDDMPQLVDGRVGFIENGEVVYLDDFVDNTPIFGINVKVTLPAFTLPNMAKETVTTYRHCIMNAIILVYPFGDKIPYHEELFSRKWIDTTTEAALRANTITVPEFKKLFRATLFIDFLNDYCVPTASRKMLDPSPAAAKLRDELLVKYKDELTDPLVVAKIDKEIANLLSKEMEDDSSSGYFVNPDKSIDKVRKKTHGMIGGVPRLDDPSKMQIITASLEEGWAIKNIPALVSSSRSGSIQRGINTAFGGEAANFSGRIYQNVRNAEEDCGTSVGVPITITANNMQDYVGQYLVSDSSKPLTAQVLSGSIGKILIVRLPATCITKNGNFCSKCLGDNLGLSGVGLGPQLSAVGNVFMSISLAQFHGAVYRTVKWDWKNRIT